jgi:hypothetical protein
MFIPQANFLIITKPKNKNNPTGGANTQTNNFSIVPDVDSEPEEETQTYSGATKQKSVDSDASMHAICSNLARFQFRNLGPEKLSQSITNGSIQEIVPGQSLARHVQKCSELHNLNNPDRVMSSMIHQAFKRVNLTLSKAMPSFGNVSRDIESYIHNDVLCLKKGDKTHCFKVLGKSMLTKIEHKFPLKLATRVSKKMFPSFMLALIALKNIKRICSIPHFTTHSQRISTLTREFRTPQVYPDSPPKKDDSDEFVFVDPSSRVTDLMGKILQHMHNFFDEKGHAYQYSDIKDKYLNENVTEKILKQALAKLSNVGLFKLTPRTSTINKKNKKRIVADVESVSLRVDGAPKPYKPSLKSQTTKRVKVAKGKTCDVRPLPLKEGQRVTIPSIVTGEVKSFDDAIHLQKVQQTVPTGEIFCPAGKVTYAQIRVVQGTTQSDMGKQSLFSTAQHDDSGIITRNRKRLENKFIPVGNVWLSNGTSDVLAPANNHMSAVHFVECKSDVDRITVDQNKPSTFVSSCVDTDECDAILRAVTALNIKAFESYISKFHHRRKYYSVLVKTSDVLSGFFLAIRRACILQQVNIDFEVRLTEEEVQMHCWAADNHLGGMNVQLSNSGRGTSRDLSCISPRIPYSVLEPDANGTSQLFGVSPPKGYLEYISPFKIYVKKSFLDKLKVHVRGISSMSVVGQDGDLGTPTGIYAGSDGDHFFNAFPSMMSTLVAKSDKVHAANWARLRMVGQDPNNVVVSYLKLGSFRSDSGNVTIGTETVNLASLLVMPTIYPSVASSLDCDDWSLSPGKIPAGKFTLK